MMSDAEFLAGLTGRADALAAAGFQVETHPHSINAVLPGSRLRIPITVNSRYAAFPARAKQTTLFGVDLPVAALEDLVQGKIWAATDPACRATKRQKDRLDLARIAETHPQTLSLIPSGLFPEVDEIRKPKE